MGIADWDRASSRAFRSELNAYLDSEADKQREAEMAEDYAKHLIKEGQECYPWTFDHFEEALQNAPRGERLVAFVAIAVAVDLNLRNEFSNHMALSALTKMVEEYWKSVAAYKAEEGKHG
jgi:hypothetical protein